MRSRLRSVPFGRSLQPTPLCPSAGPNVRSGPRSVTPRDLPPCPALSSVPRNLTPSMWSLQKGFLLCAQIHHLSWFSRVRITRSGRGGGTWRPSMLRRRSLTPIELLSVRVLLIDLKRVLELDLAVPIGFHGTGFRLKAPRARDLSANTPRPLPTRDRADRSIPTSHLAGRQVSLSLSVALLLSRERGENRKVSGKVSSKKRRGDTKRAGGGGTRELGASDGDGDGDGDGIPTYHPMDGVPGQGLCKQGTHRGLNFEPRFAQLHRAALEPGLHPGMRGRRVLAYQSTRHRGSPARLRHR